MRQNWLSRWFMGAGEKGSLFLEAWESVFFLDDLRAFLSTLNLKI